eukprot:TRINITY_DN26963_c0_g1_i1.p1 TRINITY_DN26963_c0_g1~~TRINITY_DN26963_c0_g1_i1.p1  ORF type:complete len:268 (+),score=61.47 TRINITY_DN26963_c0_g1_i1:37-804(+)
MMKMMLLVIVLCMMVPTAAIKYVTCGSTTGNLTIEVHEEWSQLGAERFLDLVESGFYNGVGLFRNVKGFLCQFGLPAEPSEKWKRFKRIKDDVNKEIAFGKGYMSFAGSGSHSRTTQVFITHRANKRLGKSPWETPFGLVVEGFDAIAAWSTEYGDIHAFNKKNGVETGRLAKEGNAYLKEGFPNISYLTTCQVSRSPPTATSGPSPSPFPAVTQQIRQTAQPIFNTYYLVYLIGMVPGVVLVALLVIRKRRRKL